MTENPRIAIAVSTYERPSGLKLLLDAIASLDIGAWSDGCVRLIIVDNSATGSAETVARSNEAAKRYALTYHREPRRGLAFARNAALDLVLESDATHVAYIDDDEVPDPSWLLALAARLQETGAAAAIGAVRPIFERLPPRWAVNGGFFAKTLPEKDGRLADGYTSNALIDLAPLRRHGLRFDPRCNLTGGEDTLFFRDLMRVGGIIVLAPAAIVFEFIPAPRTTVPWLWRRWFRTGSTEANLADHEPGSLTERAHSAARGLLRVAGGLVRIAAALPFAQHTPERLVGSAFTLCRGLGLLGSVFGRRYAEYDAPTYRPRI